MRRLIAVFVAYMQIIPKLIVLASLTAFVAPTSSVAELLEIQYDGFTVMVDCERHGAIQFEYTAKEEV